MNSNNIVTCSHNEISIYDVVRNKSLSLKVKIFDYLGTLRNSNSCICSSNQSVSCFSIKFTCST